MHVEKCFFAILLIATCFSSHAAVVYVNRNASGSGTGISWATAFTNLQTAIDSAHKGDTIFVAKGIYYPSKDAAGNPTPADERTKTFALKSGVEIFGGFSGSESTLGARNIDDNTTTLSGDLGTVDTISDNSYHVVTGAAGGAVLNGFTVSFGNANGTGDNAQSGGITQPGSLSIASCTFSHNRALFGGAMLIPEAVTIDIRNTVFADNYSTLGGGAININSSTSSGSFTNTIFKRNTSGGSGGAIYNTGSPLAFISCIFDSNTVSSQPYDFYNDGGSPKFVNCVIYGDHLYTRTGSLVLVNCIVWGGGTLAGTVTVSNSCTNMSYSGTGNITLDPRFVNASAGDFRLKNGSPCIDKADGAQAPQLDFAGNLRFDFPNAANFDSIAADIGAFEYSTQNQVPIITAVRMKTESYVGDAISVYLDSLTVLDPDNIFPDDFGLAVKPGPYTFSILNGGKQLSITPPITDSSNFVIPLQIHDFYDSSAVFPVTITMLRHVVYVDSAAQGLNNGTSWKNAYPNLKLAMQNAQSPYEIWVAKGTYFPVLVDSNNSPRTSSFQLVANGSPVFGGFSGKETQREQRNWKVNQSILSGDINKKGDSSDNCYHVLLGANDAVLDGFIITGGNADSFSASGNDSLGGGLYNSGVAPKIVNCTFRRNYARGGGAMYNYWDASPIITNCTFCCNVATETAEGVLTERTAGGAIYDNWSSNPVLNSCVFYRNSVMAQGNGAAIYHYWSDSIRVNNCTFFDNFGPGGTRTGFAVEWGGAKIRNSIMVRTPMGDLDGRGVATFSYCCFPMGDTTRGTGCVYIDPQFVDTANNDFHLKSTSLCIDQASGAFAPPVDMDGVARYDDPAFDNFDSCFADIGAYEYPGNGTRNARAVQSGIKTDRFALNVLSSFGHGIPLMLAYTIPESMGAAVPVELSIFNAKGVCVVRLVKGNMTAAGTHRVSWIGNRGGGVYFCLLRAGNKTATQKIIVEK
jgi:predicted outer membrane repeat protein